MDKFLRRAVRERTALRLCDFSLHSQSTGDPKRANVFYCRVVASREIRIHDHTFMRAYSIHTAIYWNRTSDSTKTNNHENIRSMLVVTSVHAQSARSSQVCGKAVCVCVGLIHSAECNERPTICHYTIACRFCCALCKCASNGVRSKICVQLNGSEHVSTFEN